MREGSHGRPSHVLSPLRRHCLVKRYVLCVNFDHELLSETFVCVDIIYLCCNNNVSSVNKDELINKGTVIDDYHILYCIIEPITGIAILLKHIQHCNKNATYKQLTSNSADMVKKNEMYAVIDALQAINGAPHHKMVEAHEENVRNRCIQTATNCCGNC